jgi:hypothetical protein
VPNTFESNRSVIIWYFNKVCQAKLDQEDFLRLNLDSAVHTTKTSDFAKRKTITPTSLVKVIPLKSQQVCQAKTVSVLL